MATMPRLMMSVADARSRAAKHFDNHYRGWATERFVESLERGGARAVASEGEDRVARLSISLHPPTERQAIEAGKAANEWVAQWRNSPAARYATWSRKEWPRIGAQDIPGRVVLEGSEAIATFAGRRRVWELAERRMSELASRLCARWADSLTVCDAAELAAAMKRSVAAIIGLDEDDWSVALHVFDWLADHAGDWVYVRQLPIRGIDTKWLESHRFVVEPLYRALAGCPLPFMKPPAQMRVRMLDEGLAPFGLRDVSVLPSEFASFPRKPDLVIVSENLVTVLALPDMPRAMAIHGGGYAVAALGEVAWLADARMLYWGDLDFDGFSILNRIRCHFPHVESILMDAQTLEAHRDLCVPDPNPLRAASLERLTKEERGVLEGLLAEEPALRLEQERIGWEYAFGEIARTIG